MQNDSINIYRSPYVLLLIFTLCLAFAIELLYYVLPCLMQPISYSLAAQIEINPLFATACLGGSLAYFLLLKSSNAERAAVLILGILLDAALIKERMNVTGMDLQAQIFHLGIGLCLMSLAASVLHAAKAWLCNERETLRKSLEVCGLVSAMPVLLASSGCYDTGTLLVYDQYLYAVDGIWGVQPSFIIARTAENSSVLAAVTRAVYFHLSLCMMLAQIFVYMRNEKQGIPHSKSLIPALFFILIALSGSISYAYFPAVGQEAYCGLQYFPNGPWPDAPLSPHPIEAPVSLTRNCMPSLHLSWIIAAALCVWHLGRKFRAAGGVLVGITFIATFNVGSHYLTDLIMALPFVTALFAAVQVQAAARLRMLTGITGLILFISWLSAMKNMPVPILQHPFLTGALMIITSAVSICMMHLLASARPVPQAPPAEDAEIEKG